MRMFSLFILFMISLSVQAQTESRTDVQKLFDFFCQKGVDMSQTVNHFLYDNIFRWYQTPYRYAGNSDRGIDCSGFVKMLYNNVFSCALRG